MADDVKVDYFTREARRRQVQKARLDLASYENKFYRRPGLIDQAHRQQLIKKVTAAEAAYRAIGEST